MAKDLTPIVDLWAEVAHVLGITTKQAADFVEEQISDLGLVLYEHSASSGLYYPVTGTNKWGDDLARSQLMDIWNVAERQDWAKEALGHLQYLRMTAEGRGMILENALQLAGEGRTQQEIELQEPTAEIDPADLPEELQAANIAHRAVVNGHGDEGSTFKNRLVDYLKQNFSHLTDEAIQRIAVVANPNKAPGRRKRSLK